jgi:hypothetical protein
MTIKDKTELRKALIEFGAITAMLPAAQAASQLRACGLRLVGSPEVIEVLQEMASGGDKVAELIAGNLFPQGHQEVAKP